MSSGKGYTISSISDGNAKILPGVDADFMCHTCTGTMSPAIDSTRRHVYTHGLRLQEGIEEMNEGLSSNKQVTIIDDRVAHIEGEISRLTSGVHDCFSKLDPILGLLSKQAEVHT